MELPKSTSHGPGEYESPSDQQSLEGGVLLFLRLWSYAGPSQPPSGLALDQDVAIAELIRSLIGDGQGAIAEWQPELLSARFDNALLALATAKGLQQRFLTFHRKTEPQQVVPSILIYSRRNETAAGADAAAPQDMLANVTSAQILISGSIYESVKSVPGFRFNPRPVREAGQTFGPEAIYELLWTDESTYGHLRQARRTGLEKVGRYQIEEELGRGAMGAVYKAYDRLIGRTVALKTISVDRNTPDRDDLIERLKQEAKAAGGLDHPNIITIYDVGQENDVVYLSMQFVKGITLATLLTEVGVPSLPTFISWADQISAAVGFAHARGVIHRDLKPANLMVTEQGIIKVLDFGIAKIENTSHTQTGLVVGTPSHMAPEQVAGKKVDHRADIFALGSVFYELATREKPFRGDVPTILYKIMHEDPMAPSLVNPALPGGIDAIIRKALAKDPKQRFQTCEEMRQAFLAQARLLKISPATGVPAGTPVARLEPRPPAALPRFLLEETSPERLTSRWPKFVVGLVTVLIATTSWVFYTKSRTGSFPPPLRKLVETFDRRSSQEPSHSLKPEESRGQRPSPSASDHLTPNSIRTDPSTAKNSGSETLDALERSGASTVQSQEPDAGQSSSSVPGSDSGQPSARAMSELSAATPERSAPSSSASEQPGVAIYPVAVQQSDRTQRATNGAGAANAPAANGESEENSVPSGPDDSLGAPPPATKPMKKPQPAPSLTVDGFSRRDVPELLRQADVAAGRGDYRLARYEYKLILKLDPGNSTARAGLHHIQANEPTRESTSR